MNSTEHIVFVHLYTSTTTPTCASGVWLEGICKLYDRKASMWSGLLGQFYFEIFSQCKSSTFQCLQSDRNVGRIKEPIQSRAAGVHFLSQSRFARFISISIRWAITLFIAAASVSALRPSSSRKSSKLEPKYLFFILLYLSCNCQDGSMPS